VLMRLCPDPIGTVLQVMSYEKGSGARAIGRQLLEEFSAGQYEVLVGRFEEAQGHVACDMLRVIARVGGERAAAFLAIQCSHKEEEVQDEALRQMRSMPYSGPVGRAFMDAYRHVDGQQRAQLLELMERSRDKRFVEHLLKHLEEVGPETPLEEVGEVGRVIGLLAGERYVAQWKTALKPVGWLRKVLKGSNWQQVLAASGLSVIPGQEIEDLLFEALKASIDAAEPHIRTAFNRHKQAGEAS